MIKVSACIIHEVIKEVKSDSAEGKKSETTLDLSESLLEPANVFVERLLGSIHTSFSDASSLKNTHFEKSQTTKFSTSLETYLKNNKQEDFFSFSVESIKALKSLIEKENFATGGYYVFSDYTFESRRFLSVMVIRKNKDAINLNKVNNVHQPGPSENVNTEKIAMGFRLNYNVYRSDDEDRNYIALVTSQQDRDLAGYFKNWVNAAGVISNDKNSNSFVDIIKRIGIPAGEDGKPLYSREEFQKIAHDFAEKSPNKSININTFSSYLYGEENANYIMKFATTENIVIDPEFKRSTSIFKRLVTIRAKIPGIELNVDFDKLNSNEVDVKDDIIIIRSEKLVQQINAQK